MGTKRARRSEVIVFQSWKRTQRKRRFLLSSACLISIIQRRVNDAIYFYSIHILYSGSSIIIKFKIIKSSFYN